GGERERNDRRSRPLQWPVGQEQSTEPQTSPWAEHLVDLRLPANPPLAPRSARGRPPGRTRAHVRGSRLARPGSAKLPPTCRARGSGGVPRIDGGGLGPPPQPMSDSGFQASDLERQRAFLQRLARQLVRGEAAAEDLV